MITRTIRADEVNRYLGRRNTAKAWVIENEGRIMAIFGVSIGERVTVFSDIIDNDMYKYPVTIARAGKKLIKEAKTLNAPVFAASNNIDFMEWLGGELVGESGGKKVFVWT
jgi:hypothetical protein